MTPVAQTTNSIKSGGQTDPIDPSYAQIRDLVYKVSGIYERDEKLHELAENCEKRMRQLGVENPHSYWGHLTSHPNRESELRHLLNELTIGETCLFRSDAQLEAVSKVILPEFMKDTARQFTKRLRIWSAGCSTGEEPYTLAMALLEEAEGQFSGWDFEILATDLNDRSIETAKAGVYGDYALRNTPERLKKKYFQTTDGGKLQVRPEVKKSITFSRMNMRDDSEMVFMNGMDLIFCCNVLIYFDGVSKANAVTHFYNNLKSGGYFFLGASESLLKMNSQFHLVHFPGTLGYWKPGLNRAQ